MYIIIFYSESDVFGGHEKMAVAAHAAIQQRYDCIRIHWLVSERNHYLTDALEKAGLSHTALENAHAYSLWRNPLYALLNICRNAAAFRRLSPDPYCGCAGRNFAFFWWYSLRADWPDALL